MASRSLRELDGLTLEAVLATSFGPASLHNRLADAGCAPLRASVSIVELYRHAREQVRVHPRLAAQLQRLLDLSWAELRHEVALATLDELQVWCRHARWNTCPDFGGWIWALARDPRPAVQHLLEDYLLGVARQALREPS